MTVLCLHGGVKSVCRFSWEHCRRESRCLQQQPQRGAGVGAPRKCWDSLFGSDKTPLAFLAGGGNGGLIEREYVVQGVSGRFWTTAQPPAWCLAHGFQSSPCLETQQPPKRRRKPPGRHLRPLQTPPPAPPSSPLPDTGAVPPPSSAPRSAWPGFLLPRLPEPLCPGGPCSRPVWSQPHGIRNICLHVFLSPTRAGSAQATMKHPTSTRA